MTGNYLSIGLPHASVGLGEGSVLLLLLLLLLRLQLSWRQKRHQLNTHESTQVSGACFFRPHAYASLRHITSQKTAPMRHRVEGGSHTDDTEEDSKSSVHECII